VRMRVGGRLTRPTVAPKHSPLERQASPSQQHWVSPVSLQATKGLLVEVVIVPLGQKQVRLVWAVTSAMKQSSSDKDLYCRNNA